MNYQLSIKEAENILNRHNLLIKASGNVTFNEITYDSRKVTNTCLLVCKGMNFKKEYFDKALASGFACYMSEIEYDTNSPRLIVSDIRKALSVISIAFFNRPSDSFKLTGITGTAGKTTTAYMTRSILSAASGIDTGLLSTNETYCGGEYKEAENTTPESLVMQRLFAEAKEHQLPYVTMEVSSQAYNHQRVYDQTFDIGVFMNIDKDHVGFPEHPTYENYRDCKLQLIKNSRLMLVYSKTNEIEMIKETAKEANTPIKFFGCDGDDYFVSHATKLDHGFDFEITGPNGWKAEFTTNAEGWFNLTNATAAIAIAKEYGIDDESIRKGIKNITVPGRMNMYNYKNSKIIVDYAHNRLTITECFKSLAKDYAGHAIKVVVGAAGKNHLRREDIGILCGQYATHVYLTEEDPDFEDPQEICEEIASYIPQGGNATWEIEVDRPKAVEKAISELNDGDVLILLAKGTERFRKFRGTHQPCESDCDIVERCINN